MFMDVYDRIWCPKTNYIFYLPIAFIMLKQLCHALVQRFDCENFTSKTIMFFKPIPLKVPFRCVLRFLKKHHLLTVRSRNYTSQQSLLKSMKVEHTGVLFW